MDHFVAVTHAQVTDTRSDLMTKAIGNIRYQDKNNCLRGMGIMLSVLPRRIALQTMASLAVDRCRGRLSLGVLGLILNLVGTLRVSFK